MYLSLLGVTPDKQGNLYQFQINGMIKAYIDHLSKMRGV